MISSSPIGEVRGVQGHQHSCVDLLKPLLAAIRAIIDPEMSLQVLDEDA
jgi:hypothetical protein